MDFSALILALFDPTFITAIGIGITSAGGTAVLYYLCGYNGNNNDTTDGNNEGIHDRQS